MALALALNSAFALCLSFPFHISGGFSVASVR
jgi:hypothetical protein